MEECATNHTFLWLMATIMKIKDSEDQTQVTVR